MKRRGASVEGEVLGSWLVNLVCQSTSLNMNDNDRDVLERNHHNCFHHHYMHDDTERSEQRRFCNARQLSLPFQLSFYPFLSGAHKLTH